MTRTQEARINEVKKVKRKTGFKGSSYKDRKKVKKGLKSKNTSTANSSDSKTGNETKKAPEVKPKKPKKVVERVLPPKTERNRRSTGFYGLPSEMPEKTDTKEVHKIVQQIMDEMLDRVEKASRVLNEAEKLNFDLNSAKNVLVKRQNSSESISIQFSHQEQVEEIIDILKTPTKKNTTEAKETKTGLVGKSIENNAEESEDGNAKKSPNEKLKRYYFKFISRKVYVRGSY